MTDRLSLSEVLHDTDLSTNKFLKHVSDCPVNDIPNELMEISVTDMFSEEIYGEGAIKHEGETPLIAADGQIIANGDFYTVDSLGYHKAQLKSTWKYLLTDPNGIKQPSDYKAATDMGTLVTNMTANVDNATLNSLNEDGLIADMNPATLASALIAGYSAPLDEYGNPKTTMGQLTVTEMLDYTAWISNQLTP